MIYVPTYSIDVSGNRQNIAQGFDPIHIKRQYGGIVATLLAEEIDDLEAVGDALAEEVKLDHPNDLIISWPCYRQGFDLPNPNASKK